LLLLTANADRTVTCSVADSSGWPSGNSFTIKVAATGEDGPCTDDGDLTTTVTLNRQPTVTVTGGDDQTVCSSSGSSVTINYGVTVTSASGDSATYTATWLDPVIEGDQASNVACTATGELQQMLAFPDSRPAMRGALGPFYPRQFQASAHAPVQHSPHRLLCAMLAGRS
jgi:hypothetical protein